MTAAVGRIAYAGENGQPYTAIGRTLIAQGELTRENVSLQTIRAWLLAHPDKARGVMEIDKSFIFFREAQGAGAAGTSLTPLGSLAVDLRLHALGAPFFCGGRGPRSGSRAAGGAGYRRRHSRRGAWGYFLRLWPGR